MKWLNNKRSILQIFLLFLVAVLLPVLAFLQYDWVTKMSEREATRMRQNMETSANRFAEDFDRELSNLNTAFSEIDFSHTPMESAQSGYLRWKEATSVPRLISRLFLASVENNEVEFREYDIDKKEFTEADWPEYLQEIKEGFAENVESSKKGNYSFGSKLISGTNIAIFFPQFMIKRDEDNAKIKGARYSGVIVELNKNYLQEEIFPALIQRYFKAAGSVDFNIQVREKGDDGEILFSSDPRLLTPFEKDDYHTTFFSLRFRTLFFVDLLTKKNNTKVWSGESERSVTITTKTKNGEIQEEIVESVEPVQEEPEPHVVKERVQLEGKFTLEAFDQGEIRFERTGDWILSVKHKAGSLDAAVSERRYINLIISFGILITLAVSILILIFNSRRAQKLARQQMEFVAGVSHELRTPLAVIRSAGENLADLIVNDTRRTQQYGLLIEKEGRRLSEMVEKVLLFSRVQSGNLCLNPVPTDINEIVREAANLCQAALREGGFTLEQNFAEQLPMISGDRQTLVNIVVNLISNAVKYSGESRWIGVKTFVDNENQQVCMEIADRGLGIAPEDQKRIFDSFFRAEYVRNEQIEGTGLGLSLVKRIVTEHGGRISVNSSLGEGSSFIVSLPLLSNENPGDDDAR